jgi:filamentous hemagglutinin family protein
MWLRTFAPLTLVLAVFGLSHAQITLDGSLGPAGSLNGPNYTISSNLGQIRGGNLFHSFGLFNVFTGESATFTGPNSINNIIGRVTGGQRSIIDGLIRSEIQGANLFLINPAGMVFGPNASLDVKGSFHVSTADYLKFADGAKFHADLARQSVLTTAPVSAFGFLSQNPAGISVFGSVLQLPEGNTLSVVGGDVEIINGVLQAPAGQINIASVASPGEVPLNVQNMNLASFDRLGQIIVSDSSLLDVGGNGGGTVVIRGGRLLVDSSFVLADNLGDADGIGLGIDVDIAGDAVVGNQSFVLADSFGAGRARDLQINADSLQVDDSLIGSSPFASGNAANVLLNVGNLTLTGGAQISSTTFGSGNGGTVRVTATDTISLDGVLTRISANSQSSSTGNAGDIVAEAKNVTVNGGAQISSGTFGSGDGGTVRVKATDTISLDGASGIFADNQPGSTGNAGDVVVDAKNVTVTGGAQIGSTTFGPGSGGTLTVKATDTMSVTGTSSDGFSSVIFAQANPGSTGDAGGIVVEAKTVTVNGAISSATFGSGNAGTVRVTASDTINLDGAGSLITASSQPGSTGSAGDTTVEAKNVTVTGGAVIFNGTFGSGNGGTVRVIATDAIRLSGLSGISNASSGDGSGGSIEVQARHVILTDQAFITAGSFGNGNAGDILIQAKEFHSVNSAVTTQAAFADGGNIKLSVGSLVELVNSRVTAAVGTGNGSGGNITMDPTFVILNNSSISANAFGGPGGKVTIIANVFLASPDSSVTASSELSTPGTVDIQAPITDLSGSLAPLPENVLQATSLLRQSCGARFSGGKLSSLVAGSREGLPLEPGGFMPSPLLRIDGPSTASTSQRELGPDGLEHSSILLASATPLLLTSPGCTK